MINYFHWFPPWTVIKMVIFSELVTDAKVIQISYSDRNRLNLQMSRWQTIRMCKTWSPAATIYSKWNRIPCEGCSFWSPWRELLVVLYITTWIPWCRSAQFKWIVSSWNRAKAKLCSQEKLNQYWSSMFLLITAALTFFIPRLLCKNRQILPTSRLKAIVLLLKITRIH